MKLIKLLFVTTFMLFAANALAQSADIEIIDADFNCIDEFGGILVGQTARRVVITNDGQGTVNVSVKGVCPTSQDSAVNWNNFQLGGLCFAGSAPPVPFWKYHMRPDGKYHLNCSSFPLDD